MPRTAAIPKYRRRRGRRYADGRREPDQAVVTLSGRDHYLGAYGTLASRVEFDRRIAEWLVHGRQAAVERPETITILELCDRYWKFAKTYYQKDGRCTGAAPAVRCALRYVLAWYAELAVDEFGPLALKALRERMIADRLSRKYINDHVDRIKRMFKWAVAEELAAPETYQRLAAVSGLRKGRSAARETARVVPVTDEIVAATLPHLPRVVADMIAVQRLSGCRPRELCLMRGCDIDRSGDVWLYTPAQHKTDHFGATRQIFLGPQSQAILRRYLDGNPDTCCFSPAHSEADRHAARHARRRTPLNQGNRPGTNRRQRRRRAPGEHYTSSSYRRAIHRACDAAFPPPAPLGQLNTETRARWMARLSNEQRQALKAWRAAHRWSPNRLRHAAATQVRRQFGLEAAQIFLGHAAANVTEIYAERDTARGLEIARQVG